MKNRWTLMFVSILAVVGLDQIVKSCVLTLHAQHELPIHITSFFTLKLVWNRGISFGLFNQTSTTWWLYTVIGILLGIVINWLWRHRASSQAWPLILIVGGAIGNIIDRFRYGAVVDFFDFYIKNTCWGSLHWPAFNIADASITIGGLWLAYKLFKN